LSSIFFIFGKISHFTGEFPLSLRAKKAVWGLKKQKIGRIMKKMRKKERERR